jgi:hypothetical protein
MTTEDPIVAEVRAARKKIEATYGNDFHMLYKKMMELQKQYSLRLVTSPLPLRAITWSLQKATSPSVSDAA